MDIQTANYSLSGLEGINVIIGKNGSGKSTVLREIEQKLRSEAYVRYISPERGGALSYDGGVESNIGNFSWLANSRARNQSENFRQISVSAFRQLETLVLRKIQNDPETRDDHSIKFDSTVDLINQLLDNVEIVTTESPGFQVRAKGETDWRKIESISSGETELISLAIEILSYTYSAAQTHHAEKNNWLLLDEPDVHLHPDLQHRLMSLLAKAAEGQPMKVLIATHSTAILSALSDQTDVRVAFMGHHQREISFAEASEAIKSVLPIFGTHPLSNVFNEKPILIVEGDDDERIWQQASRSSLGAIKVWPCAAGNLQSMNEYEEAAV